MDQGAGTGGQPKLLSQPPYLGDGVRLPFIAVEADRFANGGTAVLAPRPAFVPGWMIASGGATLSSAATTELTSPHADMHTFAVVQFGRFLDVPDTFGSTPHYSPVWHLAWLDVVRNGHVIRIYHLTNKHDREERLVAGP